MTKYPKDLSGERFGIVTAIKPVVEPEGRMKLMKEHFNSCFKVVEASAN